MQKFNMQYRIGGNFCEGFNLANSQCNRQIYNSSKLLYWIRVRQSRTSDVQVITCAHAKIYFCNDSRSLRIVTVEYLQQEERITRKMYSLHKYFKESSVVPSSTSTYSFLSKKDIELANDSVGTAFAKKPATTSRVGLKYNTYTPEQRAEIGKYAAENGNTSARHFSKVLDFARACACCQCCCIRQIYIRQ